MSGAGAYSALDRAIHRMAFLNRSLQQTAADVEKALHGRQFRDVEIDRPVFVTSLPRAGTTLLLEIAAGAGRFASHRYRDMPFISAPILWSRLSGRFQKEAELRERAHEDGMEVGYDSPEAFEEVVWKTFWPRKFRGDRIRPWSREDRDSEFEAFFADHVRRIIAARAPAGARTRYVSKNNANIARLGLLAELFPDGIVVVPFRHPLDQARSLQRQHLHFLEIHREDAFSRTYMKDIGHYEFGELHKPIAFEGFDDVRDRFGPADLEYWIGYWTVAFEHVLERLGDHTTLISYDRLCEQPGEGLRVLEEVLGLERGELDDALDLLGSPRAYEHDLASLDTDVVERALSTLDRLNAASAV